MRAAGAWRARQIDASPPVIADVRYLTRVSALAPLPHAHAVAVGQGLVSPARMHALTEDSAVRILGCRGREAHGADHQRALGTAGDV